MKDSNNKPKCKFCGREFGSKQGVIAHLKSCKKYKVKKPKVRPADGQKTDGKMASSKPAQSMQKVVTPGNSGITVKAPPSPVPASRLEKAAEPQPVHKPEPKQEILQEHLRQIHFYVLELYKISNPDIPSYLVSDAREKIDYRLKELSLRGYSLNELTHFAIGIRDKTYEQYLQEKELRQKAEQATLDNANMERRKRDIIQRVKLRVVDCDPNRWSNGIPSHIAAEVKLAIENKLGSLSILEIPELELTEVAKGLRDCAYAKYLDNNTSQTTQAEVDMQEEEELLNGRFICPECMDDTYDLENYPEDKAVCDNCGKRLVDIGEVDLEDADDDTGYVEGNEDLEDDRDGDEDEDDEFEEEEDPDEEDEDEEEFEEEDEDDDY